MKPKIYVETIVVSYYMNRPSRDIVTAARQQITNEWWESKIKLLELLKKKDMNAL
ncbi:MAG TPA: hypothetical protein VK186_22295 [Candidatus Deferrimicrobium sp.]|nr:hypothetical protein [Candidatus Deferrimicrobium sp.]